MRTWSWLLQPLLCGVLAFEFGVAPARAEVVPPAVAESGSVIVTAATAEVREGPSRRAEVLTVVEKGEVFAKLGRTRGWYLIRLNDEMTGWISGRAIRRHRGDAGATTYVAPYEGRYYAPYPGGYYDYYYWGQPYLSWEWYFYDSDRHRGRSRDYWRDDHRDRDRHREPQRNEDWRANEERSLGEARPRDDSGSAGGGANRDGGLMRRSGPEPRSSGERPSFPFRRR